MMVETFELKYEVRLRPKSELWWARAIGVIWPAFLTHWWTTIRFPFCRGVMGHPVGIDPMAPKHKGTRNHELCHVVQQRGAWGLLKSFVLYFFLPLPVVFSGRWFIEREPYLKDILSCRLTIDQAVSILWRGYLWAWPRSLMRAWFEREVMKAQGQW